MLNKILIFSWFTALLLTEILSAPTTNAVTLQQEINNLINSHPLVISHQKRVLAADAEINVARDNYYPTLNLYTEAGQQKYKDTGAGTDSNLNNNRYSISVSQNLFRGFKDQAKINEAKSRFNIAATTREKIKQRLVYEASTAYLAVLHYSNLSDRIKEYVDLSRQLVKKLEEQRDTGSGNYLNVYNAQLTLQRSLEQQLIVDGRKRSSFGNYERIFFHAPIYRDMNRPPSIKKLLPALLSDAISITQQNNVNISIARDRVKMVKFSRERAKGEYWPSLDLNTSYNYERNYQGVEGDKKDTRVDLRLSWKFNLGNQTGDRFRSAEYNFYAEKYSLDAALKNINKEVYQTWEKIQTQNNRNALAKETVKIAEKLFQASLESKQKGSGSDIGLLSAKIRFLDTQIALLNVQHDVVIASYELGYICGLISPDLFGE